MPFKSNAQRKYMNANRKKMEAHGVDVDEYNRATKGKKLPERVKAGRKSTVDRGKKKRLMQLYSKY